MDSTMTKKLGFHANIKKKECVIGFTNTFFFSTLNILRHLYLHMTPYIKKEEKHQDKYETPEIRKISKKEKHFLKKT